MVRRCPLPKGVGLLTQHLFKLQHSTSLCISRISEPRNSTGLRRQRVAHRVGRDTLAIRLQYRQYVYLGGRRLDEHNVEHLPNVFALEHDDDAPWLLNRDDVRGTTLRQHSVDMNRMDAKKLIFSWGTHHAACTTTL